MKKVEKLIHILLVIVFLMSPQFLYSNVFASLDPSFVKTAVASKLDFRKYIVYHVGMSMITLSLKITMTEKERDRIGAICGPRRKLKLGMWVYDAIMEKLAREENGKPGSAA